MVWYCVHGLLVASSRLCLFHRLTNDPQNIFKLLALLFRKQEKETAKLKSEEVGDMNRTKLMWRLVTYMRQGNNKAESLRRLKASLKSGPDRSAPLAIVTRDEV